MPELPEVETTCNGIRPHCVGYRITNITVRNPHLRWPISSDLISMTTGQTIRAISRRGKYILVTTRPWHAYHPLRHVRALTYSTQSNHTSKNMIT